MFLRRQFCSSKIKKDPYNILGINRQTDIEDIRNQFLKLSKKYHPDLNHDKKKECEEKIK